MSSLVLCKQISLSLPSVLLCTNLLFLLSSLVFQLVTQMSVFFNDEIMLKKFVVSLDVVDIFIAQLIDELFRVYE